MNLRRARKKFRSISRSDVCVCLFLVTVTLAAYWPARHHDFINFDDNLYVYHNPNILSGMTKESLVWSFTSFHAGNWHPLTWLSHMVDVELYGLVPGPHHMTSVLFHIANSLLLFIVFRRMTANLWQSAVVAALFALHPLHVESVAWVAERKDVLSTFFWLLTMFSYERYTRQPGVIRYILVGVFFILGLMTKPMLVTLPFVLVLMDYWPLRRIRVERLGEHGIGNLPRRSKGFWLIAEKIPLFLLAFASSIITFLAQKEGGAVGSLETYALTVRIANALVSYVKYIGKMFWPTNLAIIYPYCDSIPAWQIVGAGVLLVLITFAALRSLKQRPWFVVGWLWFVGTFVPVIGLVQVGLQALADRYTYIPLVGLFIIVAWGVPELIKGWPHKNKILAFAAGTSLLLLSIATQIQIRHWTDSVTLFEHAAQSVSGAATSCNKLGNAFIHYNLALALMEEGKTDEAIKNSMTAMKLMPGSARVHYNLGYILLQKGETDEAIRRFKQAIELNPEYFLAYYDLANALLVAGNPDKAIYNYRRALDLFPDNKDVLNDLANALIGQDHIADALAYYSKALRLDPEDCELHNNMGVALVHAGRLKEAVQHFRFALQIDPDYTDAQNNLHKTLRMQP